MNKRKSFLVKRVDVEAAISELPPLRAWRPPTLEPCHLLILSRGFEERVIAVPSKLVEQGITLEGSILLGKYRTNQDDNDRRALELMPLVDELCPTAIMECDADSPSDVLRAINEWLMSAPNNSQLHVAIDISAASSTFIVSALLALFRTTNDLRLTVFYCTAETYWKPSEADRQRPPMSWRETDPRERGVSEVHINELQTGIHHDHLPGFVIAVPSMFASRLQRCLGHLGVGGHDAGEKEIYWLLPATDHSEHKWRHDAVMHAVSDAIYGHVDQSDFKLPAGSFGNCGALDYKECARLILQEVERNAGSNISLIHMGTKLQALGAAIALVGRTEVALTYARPESFAAERYSQGFGEIQCIQFESTKSVVAHVQSIGSIVIKSC